MSLVSHSHQILSNIIYNHNSHIDMFQVTAHAIHELFSDQEETDTRVVLYLQHAAKLGYKSAVVRTPDTDIFLILLHHAHSITLTIYLDTGTGRPSDCEC